jgi:hypothetical protein
VCMCRRVMYITFLFLLYSSRIYVHKYKIDLLSGFTCSKWSYYIVLYELRNILFIPSPGLLYSPPPLSKHLTAGISLHFYGVS